MEIKFNASVVLASREVIKRYMVLFPEIKFMVFILKEFLDSRGLNDEKEGGMSPYALTIIISYFMESKKDPIIGQLLLSQHLLNILNLYGTMYNYKTLGISLRAGGVYFFRDDKGWVDKSEEGCLSIAIENPINILENLGRDIK